MCVCVCLFVCLCVTKIRHNDANFCTGQVPNHRHEPSRQALYPFTIVQSYVRIDVGFDKVG